MVQSSARASEDAAESPLRVYFTGHVVRWLTFLGRFQPSATVQQPYADLVAKFVDSLRERGLSAKLSRIPVGSFTGSSHGSRKLISASRH